MGSIYFETPRNYTTSALSLPVTTRPPLCRYLPAPDLGLSGVAFLQHVEQGLVLAALLGRQPVHEHLSLRLHVVQHVRARLPRHLAPEKAHHTLVSTPGQPVCSAGSDSFRESSQSEVDSEPEMVHLRRLFYKKMHRKCEFQQDVE